MEHNALGLLSDLLHSGLGDWNLSAVCSLRFKLSKLRFLSPKSKHVIVYLSVHKRWQSMHNVHYSSVLRILISILLCIALCYTHNFDIHTENINCMWEL